MINKRLAGIVKETGNAPAALGKDSTAPAAPGAPVMIASSDFDVTISYAASASADVSYYVAYADGSSIPCGKSAGAETTMVLTGLEPGEHSVVVCAVDSAGNTTPGMQRSVYLKKDTYGLDRPGFIPTFFNDTLTIKQVITILTFAKFITKAKITNSGGNDVYLSFSSDVAIVSDNLLNVKNTGVIKIDAGDSHVFSVGESKYAGLISITGTNSVKVIQGV